MLRSFLTVDVTQVRLDIKGLEIKGESGTGLVCVWTNEDSIWLLLTRNAMRL